MPDTKLLPENVKNFPFDNPKAKIICLKGTYYVCERDYYWDPERKRGLEKRFYLGRIVDGEYFSTEDFKRKFKRDGTPRLVEKPKTRTYTKKAKPTAEPVVQAENAAIEEAKPVIAPAPLTMRMVGSTVIFYEIARQIELCKHIEGTWGKAACGMAVSLALHWLTSNNNALYLFETWADNYLLPTKQQGSAKELTEFMAAMAEQPGWESSFFRARMSRMDEDEIFSYDATNIATQACDIAGAQYGKSKKDGYRRQIGMSVLLGHKSGQPVMFRLFPGNISDVSTVVDLMTRVDTFVDDRIVGAVLDRGYFSLENLARFSDRGHRVLMAAKMGISWVGAAAEEVMGDLWDSRTRIDDHNVWGATVTRELTFPDGKKRKVWVHIFRDESGSSLENKAFFEELTAFESDWKMAGDKSKAFKNALQKNGLLKFYEAPAGGPGDCALVRDHDAINDANRYFGFFASVSTFELDAASAIETYDGRDAIEKCFKAGKTDISMGVIRSHNDKTMQGRFIISFIALCILCELRRRMNEPRYEYNQKGEVKKVWTPLGKEMSFNKMMNVLAPISVIYEADGKPRYAEITQKQRNIAARLGCEGVYDSLPIYA